ncbi:MAG: cytochrome c biogenesis protein ResB [Halothiobacillaceae bacterium]|nr:MAG: cytochrome c biogenesis protein ResB [Halothiobacillaceae bacterium]
MTQATSHRPTRQLLAFLGSMNLAITLLVAVALASVIGTVLQQNQAYGDYLMKFGPYWFEVFRTLGLYDVYSAPWFLAILGFLVASTSACVIRNAPNMLREMRDHRLHAQEKSLRAIPGHAEWQVPMSVEAAAIEGRRVLHEAGFNLRETRVSEGYMIAGRKGALQRLGYIFTHVAIVVILIGGVLDSRIWLAMREMSGALKIETRSVPLSQVPMDSHVPTHNPSFRGNVNVPEGDQSNVLFLNVRDGYVVQELPFSVEVKDFRIEHYINGMPKSYESDIVIHDPAHPDRPVTRTIAVNHPMIYKGHAIYQASFGDGGSRLQLRAWQLSGQSGTAQDIKGAVFQDIPFTLGGERYSLEMNDFRLFNINPVEGADGKAEQKNFGPSMVFRLRDAAGQAREYENYMSPVVTDGRPVFISGVREQIGAPMHYLYLPADGDNTLSTFMAYFARLHDPERVAQAVRAMLEEINPEAARLPAAQESIRAMVASFVTSGYDGIGTELEARVPPDQLQQAFETSVRVLQTVLGRMYVELMDERGVKTMGPAEERFLADAVTAINALALYGSPVYLQMTGFEQIQASGLQITKSPGKPVVYFGSFLLILGVFMLFYLHPRRAWVLVREEDGGARVLFAATSHRKTIDMRQANSQLHESLNDRLTGAGARLVRS